MKLFALVGKPNVGKSTLFNRLAQRQIAIVNDKAGTTRDRNLTLVDYKGMHFYLVDTGGFEPESKEVIPAKMREQSRLAVEEADAVIFMLDYQSGLTPQDIEVYDYLRRSKKPVYVAINKVDGDNHENNLGEFWEAGFEQLFPLSGAHGRGVMGLLEAMAEQFPEIQEESTEHEEGVISIAIVGRPNAGKSSLTNYLIGEEKQIVHDEAGTTRDPIDCEFMYQKQRIRLIDTAGIRKKSKVSQLVDHYSMVGAVRSVDRADLALLVIDAADGVVEQDARIAGLVLDRGKALVLVVNKWDLVAKDSRTLDQVKEEIYYQLPFASHCPVVFVSAKTGQRVPQVLDQALLVDQENQKRIQTADLNRVLEVVTARHQPPTRQGRPNRIFYAAQVAIRPPSFTVHCSNPDAIPEDYKRFLLNQFRHHFGFQGCSLQIFWRSRKKKEEESA